VRAYLKWCSINWFEVPLGRIALEEYILHLWWKGNKKDSPSGFRSALRKACVINDLDDPFTKKMGLMIKAFKVDYPARTRKFFTCEDLGKMVKVARDSKIKGWLFVLSLIYFSIWQNVRIGTLIEIKFNDVYIESGSIWLEKVKGHVGGIWTILHPLVEEIVKSMLLDGVVDINTRISEGWDEGALNKVLREMCVAAAIPVHTWHDLRHTSTQYLNDLGYPQLLMQALGTWKVDMSMKHYLRSRKGIHFSKQTIEAHKVFIGILSERLQRHRGVMVWLRPKS
jgi:hypothetical protein